MKQYVFEVLEEMAKQRNRNDKVRVLKENETWALKDIIRGSMDSTIQWNLPEGEPPYTAAAAHSHPTNLTKQNGQFKYFVKGGPGDKMPKYKKEQIFIGILEGVHPLEAEIIVLVKDGKLEDRYKVSKDVVATAFPDIVWGDV